MKISTDPLLRSNYARGKRSFANVFGLPEAKVNLWIVVNFAVQSSDSRV